MPKNQIAATYVQSEVAVDDFDNGAWALTDAVKLEKRWSGEPADPSQFAEVRILWSEQALSVRYVCRQERPPLVSENPKLDQKTLGVWNTDVCEIFIAPNPETPNRYFEFEAAPNGAWVDLGINISSEGRETDWDYRSGMTTASRLAGEELKIIIRIPWSTSIPKPSEGDTWRVNIFRCVGTGNERYVAWQPSRTEEPNFHVPEVFGWLKFVK